MNLFIWLFSCLCISSLHAQRISNNTKDTKPVISIPIGVQRTITSKVSDKGTMTFTYQKIMRAGKMYFQGQLSLDSFEFYELENYEIRMAIEWGLENEFYHERSQRLAFYGRVGDKKFNTWKMVNPFSGSKKSLDDYRWFCSLSKNDTEYIDQNEILTLLEIEDSILDLDSRTIQVDFTLPIKRGYFNIPDEGVYRMALNWGVFNSSDDTSLDKVRGQVESALVWSLEYMALPDYLMREDNKITYRPKTFVFIIGKSEPFGPLFPDPYFMEELEIAIIVMYVFSIFPYVGMPGFLVIAFFLFVYNIWSISYGGYQILTIDQSDALQKKYFTLQNFMFGPVRQLVANLFLFYFALSANTFPFLNVILNVAFVGLIYVNMIAWGPDGDG